MPTVTLSGSVSIPTTGFNYSGSASGDVGNHMSPVSEVAAAKTGTLSTRTDDNTGVVAAASGHGASTGNKIDLFWDGGSRLAMDATVSGDNITLDGGSGDVLPAAATAVTLMRHLAGASETIIFTPADLKALVAYVPVQGAIHFYESDGTTYISSLQLDAGVAYTFIDGVVGDNPLTGESPAVVKMTHGDSTASRPVQAYVLHN